MANVTQALKLIKYNIKAQKAGVNTVKTSVLSGKPGIGKTVRMKELADELNMNFLHVSAPEISPESLTGIPEFVDVENFSKYHVNDITSKGTVWSIPELILNANTLAEQSGKDGCILMLDDLHEMPMATQSYLYKILNERAVSNYKLADNVYLTGACNDSDAANFNGFPSPIINRIALLDAKFDENEWLNTYASKLHHNVRSFLNSNSKFIQEEEDTEHAYGTPRSWDFLSQQYSFIEKDDKEFAVAAIYDIAASLVSDEAALNLEKHVKYMEKLNLEHYVKERKMIDLSNEEPLEQYVYGYIVNFINTIDDAFYLNDVITKNFNVTNFLTTIAVELQLKLTEYREGTFLPNGLKLFLKTLIDDEINEDDFEELIDAEKEKLKTFSITKEDELLDSVMNYLGE